MSLQKKISSAVTAVYPLTVAALIFVIFQGYIELSVWSSIVLAAVMLIASLLGKKGCFFVGILFLYPMLMTQAVTYFVPYVFLAPAWILSNIIFAVRFFLDPSFRCGFFKKGLLFYGIAFFALTLLTNGLL